MIDLTVKAKMNSHDPKYPPRIVFNCVDASHGRYNCITENNNTVNTDDKTRETPLDAAVNERFALKD